MSSSSHRSFRSSFSPSAATKSFRSTRSISNASSANEAVDDGPVTAFLNAIGNLPADEWRARTMAFDKILSSIPPVPPSEEGLTPWYQSPTTLRRLSLPISALLTDPRSTVIKSSCNNFSSLISHTGDNGRHLVKDLLPTILGMHGQTVNVIRGYALAMMLTVIPECKFKSGLPLILERLKRDKSRDVREASSRYLRAVLENWPEDYIEENIATHIGNGLARGLLDPSQKVRMESRAGFESLRKIYPRVWDSIVHKEGGIISRDMKLKRTLILAAERSERVDLDDEDVSIGSRGSTASRGSMMSRGSASMVSFHSGGGVSYHSQRTSGGTSRASGGTSRAHRPWHGDTTNSATKGSSRGRSGSAGRHVSRSYLPSSGVGGSSRIQPPSPRMSDPTASPRGSRGMYKSGANGPFAGAMLSPPQLGDELAVPILHTKDEEEAQMRAAVSIQAAARGVSTRKSILSKAAGSEETAKESDTLEMIKSARKAVHLGMTAKQMAVRRQSSASEGAHIVPPVPPSPATGESIAADFASPTGRQSPGRELVFDRNAMLRPLSPLGPSAAPHHDVQHDRIAEEEDSDGIETSALPLTNSTNIGDLKKRARVRKSSVVLQKRLSKISENVSTRQLKDTDAADLTLKPEHVLIGQELLEAHRQHVDKLMNTLRMEMDVIRDFEKLLSSAEGAVNGDLKGSARPQHPTEDEVLDYFESAALCLDQRTQDGDELRRAMDRISQGSDNSGETLSEGVEVKP